MNAIEMRHHLDWMYPVEAAANVSYYRGDHWQGSAGWIGPLPPGNAANYAERLNELRRLFTSHNIIRQVVERHVAALLRNPPDWDIPLDQSTQDALLGFWDRVDAGRRLGEALAYALTAAFPDRTTLEQISGRGYLRLYVPQRWTQGGRLIPGTVQDWLSRIVLEAPHPRQAVLYRDPETEQSVGYYTWQKSPTARERWGEVVQLEGDTTLIQVYLNDIPVADPAQLSLGGRLTHYQLETPLLITEQIRSLQRGINLTLTQMHRNAIQAGYPMYAISNANLDPSQPLTLGPGRVVTLNGLAVQDSMGNFAGYTSPTIQRFDPIPPDALTATIDHDIRLILTEVRQLHVLLYADSTASGEARIQALTDFAASLAASKLALEHAIRWLLETTLALAYALSGQTYPEPQITATLRPYLGDVPADKQAQAIALYNAGLLSRETAIQWVGIEEPEVELERIQREKQQEITPAPPTPAELANLEL